MKLVNQILFVICLCLSFQMSSFAAQAKIRMQSVGEVISITGEAERMFLVSSPEVNKRKRQKLDLFKKVYPGDLILTHADSKIVIKLQDDSRIRLGSNSSVELREFSLEAGKARDLVVYQNWGKIRLKISKRGRFKEKIQLRSKFLSVGMKNGSEILSNIYQVNSKTANDVLVLKKKARIISKDKSDNPRVVSIRPGEFFNNAMMASQRWWDLPKLTRSLLVVLKNSPAFLLPRLRRSDGSMVPLKSELKNSFSSQIVTLRQFSTRRKPSEDFK